MRLLLDTHVAVWLTTDDLKLSGGARELISVSASGVYVSIVSLWEVAIKRSLTGKRTGQLDASAAQLLADLRASGVDLLDVELAHVFAVETLPWHHRDPFDRLIVAQALHEPMRLVTSDRTLGRYSDTVIVV